VVRFARPPRERRVITTLTADVRVPSAQWRVLFDPMPYPKRRVARWPPPAPAAPDKGGAAAARASPSTPSFSREFEVALRSPRTTSRLARESKKE